MPATPAEIWQESPAAWGAAAGRFPRLRAAEPNSAPCGVARARALRGQLLPMREAPAISRVSSRACCVPSRLRFTDSATIVSNASSASSSRVWLPDLRAVFGAGSAEEASRLLEPRMHGAAYCKIKPVVAVEKKVRRRKADVVAAVELGIGNGRVEAINSKIKVTVKMGYGFRNTDNLVGLLMLRCSDCTPRLPGRSEKATRKKAA